MDLPAPLGPTRATLSPTPLLKLTSRRAHSYLPGYRNQTRLNSSDRAIGRGSGASGAGERIYVRDDLQALRFIKRARTLGFARDQIRELLSLWQNAGRASADVKTIALAHVAQLNIRIAELTQMRDTLSQLAQSCHGDDQSDCPILQNLGLPGEHCC